MVLQISILSFWGQSNECIILKYGLRPPPYCIIYGCSFLFLHWKSFAFFWIFNFHVPRSNVPLLTLTCCPQCLLSSIICIPHHKCVLCCDLSFTLSSLISIRFLKKECRLLHAETVFYLLRLRSFHFCSSLPLVFVGFRVKYYTAFVLFYRLLYYHYTE